MFVCIFFFFFFFLIIQWIIIDTYSVTFESFLELLVCIDTSEKTWIFFGCLRNELIIECLLPYIWPFIFVIQIIHLWFIELINLSIVVSIRCSTSSSCMVTNLLTLKWLIILKGMKEMFYLTTHSTHFMYGYNYGIKHDNIRKHNQWTLKCIVNHCWSV